MKERGDWRLWLQENHAVQREVWLRLYRRGSGKTGISYDEAVEEALCFGWVDIMVRRLDDESYAQKFTPRKHGSRWSVSNLERMKTLIKDSRVTDAGMTVYKSRAQGNSTSGSLPVTEHLKARRRATPDARKELRELRHSRRG